MLAAAVLHLVLIVVELGSACVLAYGIRDVWRTGRRPGRAHPQRRRS